MHNVVSLQPDRVRPPRITGVPRGGARILFFTGVRYCRDEGVGEALPAVESRGAQSVSASERMLDAAAH